LIFLHDDVDFSFLTRCSLSVEKDLNQDRVDTKILQLGNNNIVVNEVKALLKVRGESIERFSNLKTGKNTLAI
jgi:hypothetical protein